MRITPKQVKDYRVMFVKQQGGICPLCKQPITEQDKVHLDHDHVTGHLRAALHGACNLGLGKVERAARMTKSQYDFMANLYEYVKSHRDKPCGIIHPSHLTKQERQDKAKRKRQRVNRLRTK